MSIAESDPKYLAYQFWLDLLEIQFLELRVALKHNDYNHAAKEASDVISVTQDMIRLCFGKDALFEQNKRFVENLPKWTGNFEERQKPNYMSDKRERLLRELDE